MTTVSEIYPSNRTLGEQCHDAMLGLAALKNEVERLTALLERKLDQHYIAAEGTVEERKTKARLATATDKDALTAARTEANMARADVDGLEIRFKEWQGINSNARAEMNLR